MDELREQMAQTIHHQLCSGDCPYGPNRGDYRLADAVLAMLASAVPVVAGRIADAIHNMEADVIGEAADGYSMAAEQAEQIARNYR